jgi:hypothetical protein
VASDFRRLGKQGCLVCCGLFAACLNPQPDLEPTFDSEIPSTPVDVRAETCDDNPLLARCPSNGTPPAAQPASPGGIGNGVGGSGGMFSDPSSGGGAGSTGMGDGDAGPASPFADTQPVDAGVGDAQAP